MEDFAVAEGYRVYGDRELGGEKKNTVLVHDIRAAWSARLLKYDLFTFNFFKLDLFRYQSDYSIRMMRTHLLTIAL